MAYCPGFAKLLGIACSRVIGNIRGVDACFTKLEKKESRELSDITYSGSFTELGSYCLLPILKLFGHDYQELRFDTIKADNGVDLFTRAYLRYSGGLATATCGLGVKSEGKLLISGTEGYIVVEEPWWKTSYFEVHHEDPNDVERFSERFLTGSTILFYIEAAGSAGHTDIESVSKDTHLIMPMLSAQAQNAICLCQKAGNRPHMSVSLRAQGFSHTGKAVPCGTPCCPAHRNTESMTDLILNIKPSCPH